MERDQFLETVADRTDTDRDTASDATQATLSTLGERLSDDQAHDLAAELPGDLSASLTRGDAGRRSVRTLRVRGSVG